MTLLDDPTMLNDRMDVKANQLDLLEIHFTQTGREYLRPTEAGISEETSHFDPGDLMIVANAKDL